MKADRLRAFQRRRPFHPFEIVLETGEAYRVNHPEQLAIGEDHVFWSDGRIGWSVFGPENVSEIRSVRNGSAKRR